MVDAVECITISVICRRTNANGGRFALLHCPAICFWSKRQHTQEYKSYAQEQEQRGAAALACHLSEIIHNYFSRLESKSMTPRFYEAVKKIIYSHNIPGTSIRLGDFSLKYAGDVR